MASPVDPACQAFKRAIEVLSRPWTGQILTVLHDGPLRFSQLSERTRGLGDKTLSARLKDLEARGLVTRHVDGGPPVRVLYDLTSKGRAFWNVAEAIQRWGADLVADEPAAQRAARRRTPA